MTAYRQNTPDVDAVQYTPTHGEPLTFSERPEWLEQAIEIGKITERLAITGDPYLALQAHLGVELVAPGDWIIEDRWGHIHRVAATDFDRDYELFTGPQEPAADALTDPQATKTPAVTA